MNLRNAFRNTTIVLCFLSIICLQIRKKNVWLVLQQPDCSEACGKSLIFFLNFVGGGGAEPDL